MQGAHIPFGLPRDRCRHGKEWIVWIAGREYPVFLQGIGPAPRTHARLENTAERLKPAQPVVAKLPDQGASIQIQPGWLNIDHDAEALHHLDCLAALEIRVFDARTRASHR